MNRFTAFLSIFTFLTLSLNAQSKLFNSGDKVVVQISNTYGKVYVHEMDSKQTVYSLAKAFNQRMADVQSVNPGVNFDAMKVGQKIRVPFMAAYLVKSTAQITPGGEYVKVYYKVRPKDNLYRIAKVYFDTSIENLMEINNVSSFDLKADQLIKIGWMPIGSTPIVNTNTYTTVTPTSKPATPTYQAPTVAAKPEVAESNEEKKPNTARRTSREKAKKKGFFARVFGGKDKKKKRRDDDDIKEVVQLSEKLEEKPAVAKTTPNVNVTTQKVTTTPAPTQEIKQEQPVFENVVEVPAENIDLETPEAAETPTYHYKSEKGIAIWNQTSSNSRNMFVLHPTAAVGSFIEITNPMLNKTVQAKVIGNIPPRTYTDDVSIVVSPRVAKMLGVVDRRFAVHVKYREE